MNINIDEMGELMEKLQKTSTYCAKELEANEVARNFKIEVEKYKDVLATL